MSKFLTSSQKILNSLMKIMTFQVHLSSQPVQIYKKFPFPNFTVTKGASNKFW